MSGKTITLADGTVIDVASGRPVRNANVIQIPTSQEAVAEVTRVRKRVHELPEPPEKMNAIALVASYYLFGLSDADIAYVTQLTETQVGNIRMLDAFDELVTTAQQNVVAAEGDQVRALIAQNSMHAATTISNMMASPDDKVALVAAKDMLDRAGHRPNDVIEHRHKIEGGLQIEYVQRSTDSELPAVEVTYEDVTDD